MTPAPAALGVVQPDGSLRRGQVLALLLAALPLLLLQPYQWLSALGFRLQRTWPLGEGGAVPGGSLLLVFAGMALLILLANGHLQAGGGGLTGVLALQLALRARLAPLKRLHLPVLLATGSQCRPGHRLQLRPAGVT